MTWCVSHISHVTQVTYIIHKGHEPQSPGWKSCLSETPITPTKSLCGLSSSVYYVTWLSESFLAVWCVSYIAVCFISRAAWQNAGIWWPGNEMVWSIRPSPPYASPPFSLYYITWLDGTSQHYTWGAPPEIMLGGTYNVIGWSIWPLARLWCFESEKGLTIHSVEYHRWGISLVKRVERF